MEAKKKAWPFFELLIGLICISTSGPLGSYIPLPPELTIFGRTILAAAFMFVFAWFSKVDLQFRWKKDGWVMIGSSVLMTGHWITYFYALQLSNVAIGMLTLFTFPVITSFLEPLLLSGRISLRQVFLGVIVLIGVYFLMPEDGIGHNYSAGILFGLGSAVLFSIRNIMVKQLVTKYKGTTIMTYQLICAAILLLPVLFNYNIENAFAYWPYILFLGIVTTAFGHTLFARSFRHFSATTTSLIGGMQPIFGIILGIIFLSEIPESKTLIGGIIILSTVFLEAFTILRKT